MRNTVPRVRPRRHRRPRRRCMIVAVGVVQGELSPPDVCGSRYPPPGSCRGHVRRWSTSSRRRGVSRPARAERTCHRPDGCRIRYSPRRRFHGSSGSGRRSTPSNGHRIAHSSAESVGRIRRPGQPLARPLTHPTSHPPPTMMRWLVVGGAGRGDQPCDASHGNAKPTGRPVCAGSCPIPWTCPPTQPDDTTG